MTALIPVDTKAAAPTLAEAIKITLAYSDVFDHPLTRDELWRYLVATPCSRAQFDAALDGLLRASIWLDSDGEFYFMRGRERIVALRREREVRAAVLRHRARQYGRLLWALPFVRMVGLTGSLAVDAPGPNADIDLFLVTAPGRLWTVRAAVLAVSRLARLRGDTLCPNYIVSTLALEFEGDDLYVAREMAQMVPLYGTVVTGRLWRRNRRLLRLLPNAGAPRPQEDSDDLPQQLGVFKALGEAILSLPYFDRFERWEQRKIERLSAGAPPRGETLFSTDVCKGHDQTHGRRIMSLWRRRLTDLRIISGRWRGMAAAGE